MLSKKFFFSFFPGGLEFSILLTPTSVLAFHFLIASESNRSQD